MAFDLSFFRKVNLGKFLKSKGNEFQTNGLILRNKLVTFSRLECSCV